MITAIAIMLFGLLHGLVEGMVMTRFTDPMADPEAQDDMDGVRVHRWFKAYHWLCLARYGALIAVVLRFTQFPTQCFLTAGAAFLGWQFSEMAYHYARYRKVVTGQENVLGCWNLKDSAGFWLLNVLRLLIGAGLITGGLL